jgi:hypothetical protein
MAALLDVCRFAPTLAGTTDWTYSSAITGYQSPAAANVVNGRLYKYRAESADLSQWEIGEGAYNTSTGVLARATVLYNSLGTTAKISFSTVPQVAVVALKEDLISIEEANSFTSAQKAQARVNIGMTDGQLPATTTNDNAGSGNIGEYVTATAGPVSLTSATAANVTSISLTAGDWDVTGNVVYSGNASTTVLYTQTSVSAASLTQGEAQTFFGNNVTYFGTVNGSGFNVEAPVKRVSIAAATTVYLIAFANFGAGSMAAAGTIRARRVR